MPFLHLLAPALAGAFLLATPAAAADWPTRPVKLVVSYPAGGSADAIARPYADGLSKKFGQPFVIENKAGAAGAIGTEAVTKAAPDGYTFLAGPIAPLVLLPHLRKIPYDPQDLVPIALLGEFVYAFAVLPSLGPKNVAELVELAKKKPGQLTYSSPGAGSATNLRGEAFKLLAGIDLLHVPYRTGAEALIDFLGGRVDVMIDNVHFPHAKAGKVVLLAMTTDKRHPDFPDVPTMAEAGYPVDLGTPSSLYAPKGTPQEIMDRIGQATREITSDPDVQQKILKIGFFPTVMSQAELIAMHAKLTQSFGEWVKKTNLKIE